MSNIIEEDCTTSGYSSKLRSHSNYSEDSVNGSENNSRSVVDDPISTEVAQEASKKAAPSQEKKFKCDKCTFATLYKPSLKNHVKRMHYSRDERPFRCDFCNHSYAVNSDFVKHLRIHTGDKPFACSQCEYKSNLMYLLERHVMMNHTGERPYKCDQCTYSTVWKNHFKLHARKHTGDFPFSCFFCDYRCNYPGLLKKHFISKHGGDKPFKCDQCAYETVDKRNFSNHVRTHSGDYRYPCSQCDYGSNEKKWLQHHVLRHHIREKPFACDKCSFTSLTKKSLVQHALSHGVNPVKHTQAHTDARGLEHAHPCTKCGSKLISKEHLKCVKCLIADKHLMVIHYTKDDIDRIDNCKLE